MTGATQYNVYRYNGTSKTYVYKGTAYAASYTDTGLTVGTTYYYKVCAVTKDSQHTLVSDLSAAANCKVLAVPAVPASPAAKQTADKTITVSWKAVSGATQYNVYRYNGTKKDYVYKGTSTTTSYKDAGLNVGTTYYYKVCAVYKDSQHTLVSDLSAAVNAKVNAWNVNTLPAPTGIAIKQTVAKTLTLSWKAVSGATQYNIYRYSGAEQKYLYKGTAFTNSYSDGSLAVGTTYYYKVVAVYKDSATTIVSPQSSAVSLKVLAVPAVPQSVSAHAAGSKTILLFWDDVANATQYNVYRYSSAKKSYVYYKTVYDFYLSDANLTVGTTYYYKVVAVTKDANHTLVSDLSAAASATVK